MYHPSPLYNAADLLARFRHLARSKQLALVGLNGLGLLLLVVTCLYVIQPNSTASAPNAPAAGGALARATPVMAGQYVLQDATLGQTIITLRQFGDAITGIATSATCDHGAMRTTQRIITGQLLPANQLRLTFTSPDQPHSASITYQLAATSGGFTLIWSDAAGRMQTQQWQRVLGEDPLTNRC